MRFYLMSFDKRAKDTKQLQEELQMLLENNKLQSLSVSENPHTGDILFELLADELDASAHSCVVFPLRNIKEVAYDIEVFVNNMNTDQKIEFVKLLPLGGQRALGLIISSARRPGPSDATANSAKETKRGPNKASDGRKNSRTAT